MPTIRPMYYNELFKLTLSDFDNLARTLSRAEYCRILGQWHIMTSPMDDSMEQGEKMLREAAALGDAEAKLHLANMYRLGDLGKVDMDEYGRLLAEAIDGGCQLAEIRYCKDIAYGVAQNADLDLAIEETRRRLASQDSPDPRWYNALGWMLHEKGRFSEANEMFLKAIALGYVDSYMGLTDMPEKQQEGREAGCGGSCVLLAEELKRKYDENSGNDTNAVECFSDDEQKREYLRVNDNYRKELATQIEALYEEAARMGETLGLYYQGMLYYKAQYNHYEDDGKAFDCFMRGNRLGDSFCMSMLADMILEGRTPEEYSYEDACFFQLKALRYGDDEQLASVLHAYFEGDLKEYADEIERYYLPRFYEEEDDIEDDDGRYDAWA